MLCERISLSYVKVYWAAHISQVVLKNRCVRQLECWNILIYENEMFSLPEFHFKIIDKNLTSNI